MDVPHAGRSRTKETSVMHCSKAQKEIASRSNFILRDQQVIETLRRDLALQLYNCRYIRRDGPHKFILGLRYHLWASSLELDQELNLVTRCVDATDILACRAVEMTTVSALFI